MQTILSQFCEEFDQAVRPLLAPLDRATDSLDQASEDLAVRALLPEFQDVRHQFKVLADKVAEQQAYVLIFGPLKSGKSTLMNAMSAAYVSEVTSLPAYPCMVYVSHADKNSYTITRYNGDEENFADLQSMRIVLQRAHGELAERMREVERQGETFDPAVHFPSAIRRVDIRLPAENLKESGAVLVDTPGLYTRMKFGYDRMTRDFRNSAACAIFVVKTDNLFLEQVFEEFNSLLDLFSRIFLVVNLDSSKQDLQPDGSLQPSLEKVDPARVIQAFEELAMSAPLKQAAADGRLRIYPMDLLRAASRRLHDGAEDAGDDAAEGSGADAAEDAFDPFLTDLTQFLDSTDYLVAFVSDSLRQARALLGELHQLGRAQPVSELEQQMTALQRDREEAGKRTEALQALEAFDWEEAFQQLRERLLSTCSGSAEQLLEGADDAIEEAVDEWFRSNESFQQLLEARIAPTVRHSQMALSAEALDFLRSFASGSTAGADLDDGLRRRMALIGLPLEELGRKQLDALSVEDAMGDAVLPVTPEGIPVRRGLLDWLLLRSRAKVNLRLFGAPDRPSRKIPRALKEKRLGEAGRDAVADVLEEGLETYCEEEIPRMVEHHVKRYVMQLLGEVRERLAEIEEANRRWTEHLETRQRELGRVADALRELHAALPDIEDSVGRLTERHHAETAGLEGETEPSDAGEEASAEDDTVEVETR